MMKRRLAVIGLIALLGSGALAKPPAITIHQSDPTTANELSIAINPADPSLVVAGANTSFFFRSSDGGVSWDESHLNSTLGVAGDPCVIFDDDGNLFYSHLSYPDFGGSWLDRIVVQKSVDGGLTWSDGLGIGLDPPKDQDKSLMAADRTHSPYRHNLYIAWTEFDVYGSTDPGDSTRILFSRSEDRGLSWSEPVRISEMGGDCVDEDETVEGATPAVGPEGQVYMAWSGHDEIVFDRSLDGGATFGEDIFITTQPGGWDFSIPGIYRANGLPVTACDRSRSQWQGRIYVVFSDQRNGTDDTDIFLCTSDDQGLTWTEPQRVDDDAGASHQFYPWIAVDPYTGIVAVVYYDRSNTTGFDTDVVVAMSRDGGASFSSMVVSNAPFSPWGSRFFGDYIGIDGWQGVFYATWMSMDEGHLGVWLAKLEFPSGVGGTASTFTSLVMKAPATSTNHKTKIRFTTYHDAPVRLAVYDVRGRLVRDLVSEQRSAGQYSEMWDGTDRSGGPVASGMYLVRLQAGKDVVTRKVVKVD